MMTRKLMNILVLLSLLFGTIGLSAQDNERKAVKLTRSGNEAYEKGDFKTAEEKYQMALQESGNHFKAQYNLANDYFRQERYQEATEAYESVVVSASTPEIEAQIYHNLGNSKMMEKDFEGSIDAYKQALRINPKDQETRYNLSYAMEMLKKQQEENKDQDKDQDKQDQDKDQEKQDQDKDQEKKDQEKKDQDKQQDQDKQEKQDQEKKDQDKQEQDKQQQDKDKEQQQKPEEGKEEMQKMSKKETERILQAIAEKEKETKEKLDKRKVAVSTVTIEKDW